MRQTSLGRILLILMVAASLAASVSAHAAAAWTSPNRYRVLLAVDPRGVVRRNSPASVDVDLQQALADQGSSGKLDDATIEVMAYNAAGQPVIFDGSRTGYEKYLLPWRIQKYYPITKVTLSFVIPDQTYTQYAVYFDTVESGLGKPTRYPGIVGDGDKFSDGYGRREIIANIHDDFADLDGDGDLDLFKGGVEPFVYCYENVGGNKFVDRGRLTSGGNLLTFPCEGGNNRSWIKVEFADWDNDGDQDLFAYFGAPTLPTNYMWNVVRYENTTVAGGPLTFVDRGMLKTQSGKSIDSNITIVDWDGDGKKDVLGGNDGMVTFFKNVGTDSSPVLADGQFIKANGSDIQMWALRMDCADIDNDGDLDLFVCECDGKVFWFTNVGTRTAPVLAEGKMIVFFEGGYSDLQSGIKIADWDGDGLLDMVIGCYWQRTHWGEQPRMYGRLYKNVGTPTNPAFEARDAYHGAPYTERFQQCDALLQNGVRSCDWNSDGKLDLIASDTDGFVWFFRNTTNQLFPIFAPGERLMAGNGYVKVQGEEERRMRDGYARTDIADWNNDGKKDLLVADGGGWIWLYLNVGTDANPVLAEGTRVVAHGLPIDGTARSSVLICDWDNDGVQDLIQGMTGQDTVSLYWDWPWQDSYPADDSGYLFYRNGGTNEFPILEAPQWIYGGSQVITYNSRPNLGSFVDWDGDGKKDFITGEFESSARFYKNIGSGAPGALPVFADKIGVHIVQPWTVQMMSGADAVNWNGDSHPYRPEYDIVTGQGHGGSGLRFYERDYIEDSLNNTFPIVAVGASSQEYVLGDVKGLANGASVTVTGGIVTAKYSDCCYVESSDRRTGIRVEGAISGVAVGTVVDVTGSLNTNANGERYINASIPPAQTGSGSVGEMALSAKTLGGTDLQYDALTGKGQRGVDGGSGLNNIGLFVKIAGRCTLNLTLSGADYYGKRYIFIDDGSGIVGVYRASDGSYREVNGVKVETSDGSIAVGRYITARGISSIELVNGVYQRRLLPRSGLGEISKL